MKNFYPELPIIPYKKTTVGMGDVIMYISKLPVDKEIKRATYIVFRNESANGNSGINNNYIGFQADSGRWQKKYDQYLSGVISRKENGTNKQRLFLGFKTWQNSIDILSDRLAGRGIFIGGFAHKIAKMNITNKAELATAYKREWVTGIATATPSTAEFNSFISMYNQAENLFK